MTVRSMLDAARLWLGIERNATSHGEKWISGVGALLGIVSVYCITRLVLPDGTVGGLVMLASMGASAVLLFAVPHGALSQPWAVFGGHLVSALIGVSCQKMFPGHAWTAALAVGAAVCAMHYLRCIHPPGGATSLAAVIGGADVHALGYHYLLMPVLVNVSAILLMAVAFNALFPWRRYPAHLQKRLRPTASTQPAQRQFDLTQEDFHAAMEQLDSYVDITADNLADLLELAKQHAERDITHPGEIVAGTCYSNGKLGRLWSVRQVLDVGDTDVTYRVIAGADAPSTGSGLRSDFRQWARFAVRAQDNGRWIKAG